MSPDKKYCSYSDYHTVYDPKSHVFDVFCSHTLITTIHIDGVHKDGTKVRDFKDFPFIKYHNDILLHEDFSALKIFLRDEEETETPLLTFSIYTGNGDVRIGIESSEYDSVAISGTIYTDAKENDDVFAVRLDKKQTGFGCALGNAISPDAHAIYNRSNDKAIVIGEPHQAKLTKGENMGEYNFTSAIFKSDYANAMRLYMKKDVLAEEYHIKFSPRNRNSVFPKPPIGWMTWYAVKFDACEENVLANAKWQAENLKDFGADTIWVDWEWFHPGFSHQIPERTDGVCSLKPAPEKYPHGMKYVAEEIKKLGLIPALWVTFFNEPAKSEFIEKYPDMVFLEETEWCGKYWLDPTHPRYLDEYLPKAVQCVHDWEYEAIKIDVIPLAVIKLEEAHHNLFDPSLSTKEILRNVIKKVRELVGENMYMLSCSGSSNSSILWASDIFDSARIGDDVFSWKNYLDTVKKLQFFYGTHNIQLHNDPDNVVLRDEFSNFEQAKSRLVLHSLLGLPMTFGDEFRVLGEEKIDMIKRSLPILDIHPTDLFKKSFDTDCFPLNLKIAMPYEDYQVTAVFNSTEEKLSRTFNLLEDFQLESGTYLVYDFYRDKFLGKVKGTLDLDLNPFEARVLSFRPCLDIPQIISTSRHITQGAAEILDMCFCDNTLSFKSSLVAKDSYTVTLYVPDGYNFQSQTGFTEADNNRNILKLSLVPTETTEFDFSVTFEKI